MASYYHPSMLFTRIVVLSFIGVWSNSYMILVSSGSFFPVTKTTTNASRLVTETECLTGCHRWTAKIRTSLNNHQPFADDCYNDHPFVVDVSSWLKSCNIPFQNMKHLPSYNDDKNKFISSPFPIFLLCVNNKNNKEKDNDDREQKIALHLLPTPTALTNHHNKKDISLLPHLCKQLTDQTDINIIHLHQDVWNNKKDIVQARIQSKVPYYYHHNSNDNPSHNRTRKYNRWFARKTIVRRINITMAMEFLMTHHLWGATRAKYNYGLFQKTNNELIAVATFSSRRHVQRNDDGTKRPFRSHELIRYCSRRDGHVIGGITKLISAFCRDVAPDDIVTCIDRDWGDGEGWKHIGFDKVHVMPPLLMAVNANDGIRRYLVGAGIGTQNPPTTNNNNDPVNDNHNGRPGITLELYQELDKFCRNTTTDDTASISTDDDALDDHAKALDCIHSHGLFPVYDAGVERRMLLVERTKLNTQAKLRRNELGLTEMNIPSHLSTLDLWNRSTPSFPSHYYSPNTGINALYLVYLYR